MEWRGEAMGQLEGLNRDGEVSPEGSISKLKITVGNNDVECRM